MNVMETQLMRRRQNLQGQMKDVQLSGGQKKLPLITACLIKSLCEISNDNVQNVTI